MQHSKPCLAIIDIQTKLLPHIYNNEELLKQSSILIKAFKALDLPILWFEQYPKGLGPTESALKSLLNSEPYIKSSFSAAYTPEQIHKFKDTKCDTVVLCGMESHICVFQTARDLIQHGFQVQFCSDAISSRTAENKAAGINAMQQEGAKFRSVETVLFDILKTSQHPDFKAVQKLLF
jgi:nicotinamidase-related amidase